jgi:hypothetical protein
MLLCLNKINKKYVKGNIKIDTTFPQHAAGKEHLSLILF